jgi:hypothetical protein
VARRGARHPREADVLLIGDLGVLGAGVEMTERSRVPLLRSPQLHRIGFHGAVVVPQGVEPLALQLDVEVADYDAFVVGEPERQRGLVDLDDLDDAGAVVDLRLTDGEAREVHPDDLQITRLDEYAFLLEAADSADPTIAFAVQLAGVPP